MKSFENSTVNFGLAVCALPSCNCLTSLVRINFGMSVPLVIPGGNGILHLI